MLTIVNDPLIIIEISVQLDIHVESPPYNKNEHH